MDKKSILKKFLNVTSLMLIGILLIVFSIMYIETFSEGFFNENKNVIVSSIVFLVSFFIILSIIFFSLDNNFVFKISTVIFLTILLCVISLYFLKTSGILSKISNVTSLRNYVASFGASGVFVYILLQFLQVVVLPIPAFISTVAGVYLFGSFYASIYSLVGILLGSVLAFMVGRFLGYKVVKWLIGKETLDKWLLKIKNKDKIILTFMFLFPFFPDDVLCFVAGLSSMSVSYFLIMITICRIISIFFTTYSVSGAIIPYTTWWGILIWITIFILTIILSLYLYKNGEKIQKFFKKTRKK